MTYPVAEGLRLMGYELVSAPTRRPRRGFGQVSPTYPLDDGAVLELKQALHALAKRGADPLQSPDPITEDRWKRMALTGPHAGAWDGPSADEFVAAISRHAGPSGIPGPYMQIGGSKFGVGIVGGPQPTAAGLEVIAGAVQQLLGGQPAMTRYLAWRSGVFAPPSTTSMPGPEHVVVPSTHYAALWDPEGYTPTWPDGDPQWVQAAAQIDAGLVACWQQLLTLQTEEQRRLAIAECVLPQRLVHHQATLKANAGAPEPECPWPLAYNRAEGTCYKPAGVIDLPPVDLTDERCVQAYMELEGKTEEQARRLCNVESKAGWGTWGAIIAGVGLGVGIYLWQRKAR